MPHVFSTRRAGPQRIRYLFVFCVLVPAATRADTITVTANRDTTLYRDFPTNSNGGGQALFVGDNGAMGGGAPRRGLIGFDIAATIPAGAIITDVQFSLFLDRAAEGDTRARSIELHRLVTNWGEGTSGRGTLGSSGKGFSTPANGTAATWTHPFYNTTPWAKAGGDFVTAASGSAMVGTVRQNYVWTSTSDMVSDVQGWLDNPSGNFGWILLGDESAAATARRFDTHEANNATLRPTLRITFSASPVPAPATLLLAALGAVASWWLQKMRGVGQGRCFHDGKSEERSRAPWTTRTTSMPLSMGR